MVHCKFQAYKYNNINQLNDHSIPAGDTISNRTHLSASEPNAYHTFIIRHSYTTEANQSELTTANFCGHIVGTLQNDHGFMPTCLR